MLGGFVGSEGRGRTVCRRPIASGVVDHCSSVRCNVFSRFPLNAVQLGLQVQVGHDVRAVKEGIHEYKVGQA